MQIYDPIFMGHHLLFEQRANYSQTRLHELQNRIAKLPQIHDFPDLAIVAAGSYGRLEASLHSDIDVFFYLLGDGSNLKEPRTKQLRLFGKFIEEAEHMEFPKFSNDCQYLEILKLDEILSNLGSQIDDHKNYFTARMLFLLESRCLFGEAASEQIRAKIIESYFKDFPDHPQTFQPIFLINDICRYWKTMLLNYEHKRGFQDPPDPVKKTKQKVRNFKLKYSRMTICFASIAALGSYLAPVTQDQVIAITKITPSERLRSVMERIPKSTTYVEDVLKRYAHFLEMTALPTEDLEKLFSDKGKRVEMFNTANEYGDSMFRLLQFIDETDPRLKLLRTLVI